MLNKQVTQARHYNCFFFKMQALTSEQIDNEWSFWEKTSKTRAGESREKLVGLSMKNIQLSQEQIEEN